MPLGIGERVGDPVLPRSRRLHLERGFAVDVCCQVPLLNNRLDRFTVLIANSAEHGLAGTGDRLVIQGVGREGRPDGVAAAIVAAVDPGVDFEGLAGHKDGAFAHDCATGFVGYLGRDLVAVILVAVHRFREGGVDIDRDRAVRADSLLKLGHDFRWLMPGGPPPSDGAETSPGTPAGVPFVVVSEPPVARTVEPIPRRRRIPAGIVSAAQHLDLHLGVGDRGSEVVIRFHLGRNHLAQHDGLIG